MLQVKDIDYLECRRITMSSEEREKIRRKKNLQEQKAVLEELRELLNYANDMKMSNNVIQSLIGHKMLQEKFLSRLQ